LSEIRGGKIAISATLDEHSNGSPETKTADAELGRFLETSHKAVKRQRELQFGKKRISSWVFGLITEPTIFSQKERSIDRVCQSTISLARNRSFDQLWCSGPTLEFFRALIKSGEYHDVEFFSFLMVYRCLRSLVVTQVPTLDRWEGRCKDGVEGFGTVGDYHDYLLSVLAQLPQKASSMPGGISNRWTEIHFGLLPKAESTAVPLAWAGILRGEMQGPNLPGKSPSSLHSDWLEMLRVPGDW
jgi:hypothetical protein